MKSSIEKQMLTTQSWSKRIKARMKELGMTQEELARKMGVTRGAVTHYLAGRRVPPLRQFQKLASILKVEPSWLQYGTPEETSHGVKIPAEKKEKLSVNQNSIPIFSWEQVGEFIDISKLMQGEIKEWLPHFYTDNSHWYALSVKGDSMIAPSGAKKSFHEGDLIIIDPNKAPTHGHYVIAILPRSKQATFKQYVIDGGVRYLKPLNPQYPITQIDESTHICGVVVGCLSTFI